MQRAEKGIANSGRGVYLAWQRSITKLHRVYETIRAMPEGPDPAPRATPWRTSWRPSNLPIPQWMAFPF